MGSSQVENIVRLLSVETMVPMNYEIALFKDVGGNLRRQARVILAMVKVNT